MKKLTQLKFFTLLLTALFNLLIGTAYAERTVTYFHHDAQGSVVAATNEFGDKIWEKGFTPYGEQTDQERQIEARYTGKQYDPVTGFVYFGQRYYDPEVGRFLTQDPVEFYLSNPMSFNRYTYANNNPYRFIDPDGRSAVTAFGGFIAESYNFLKGDGFDGANIIGALRDGYDGEGKGVGYSVFEDVSSFVPLGTAVKVFRFAKLKLGGSAAKSTPQILKNGVQGDLGEAAVRQRLLNNNSVELIGEQVRIRTPGIGSFRVTDFLVRGKNTGQLRIIEVKTGGATRNASQLGKDALIANPQGATTFFGRRARGAGFSNGTPTGPVRTFEVNASNLNR